MLRIELDSAVPVGPLNSFDWCQLTGDLAICTEKGIYILEFSGPKLVRRFFPLSVKLKSVTWYPGVFEGIGAALAAVSSDGRAVFVFDCLSGSVQCIHESPKRITSLKWLDLGTLSIGTIEGQLVQFNLKTKTISSSRKLSDSAVFDSTQNGVLDAHGRFFYKGRLALDDGILQPCALLENDDFVYFVKWKNVYRFQKRDESIDLWTLEEVNCVFVDAILANSLICITDSNDQFVLTNAGLKRVSQVSDGTASPIPVSDDEGDTEADAINENDSEEVTIERDKVFGLCRYRGRMAALFGSSTKRSAWIGIHEISTEDLEVTAPKFEDVFLNVPCPLCPDSSAQKLKTTTTTCTRGHPISICSDTLSRIDLPKFYRCRRCNRSYKTRLDSCKICGFFLGKNK